MALNKIALILITALMCSACTAPFKMYAHWQDSQDPCQRENNGGQYPSFCGAGAGKAWIYKGQGGAPIGYTKP